MRSVSRMSQSSKWSQLRTIYKMWINLSFMLWRNRISKRLSSISNQKKRPGMIEYPAKVFKDSLPTTLPVITNLINSLFASKCFAQAWKSATVIPNLKSGDPDEPENTRPISLLPIMSKVCEKAAYRPFMDFLDKIARYLAYTVEIESSTPLKPPYCTTRTSSLRIWMKNVYRLLCCSTCLKLSTASNRQPITKNALTGCVGLRTSLV